MPRGNPENLKPYQFSSTNQPANRGRKKGSVEIAAKIRKLLDTRANSFISNESKHYELLQTASLFYKKDIKKITAGELLDFRQFLNAMETADNTAIKELRDRVYGKVADEVILDMPEETIQAISRSKKSPLDDAMEMFKQMDELNLTDEQKKEFIQKTLGDKD